MLSNNNKQCTVPACLPFLSEGLETQSSVPVILGNRVQAWRGSNPKPVLCKVSANGVRNLWPGLLSLSRKCLCCIIFNVGVLSILSFSCICVSISPWYNRPGWPGIKKHKLAAVCISLFPTLTTSFCFILKIQLMEGRKSVGGKLEVKVRVRDPFKGRQVEESKEKWLVIDQFIRTLGSKVSGVLFGSACIVCISWNGSLLLFSAVFSSYSCCSSLQCSPVLLAHPCLPHLAPFTSSSCSFFLFL